MESETEAKIEQKIVKVAGMTGVVLKPEDISIAHRLGNKRKARHWTTKTSDRTIHEEGPAKQYDKERAAKRQACLHK